MLISDNYYLITQERPAKRKKKCDGNCPGAKGGAFKRQEHLYISVCQQIFYKYFQKMYNRYMEKISTEVQGVWKYKASNLIEEGTLVPGTKARLKRQPKNRHDSNAIEVYVARKKIGYLPRNLAFRLAKNLDRGAPYEASVVSIGDRERKFNNKKYVNLYIKLDLLIQDSHCKEDYNALLATSSELMGRCGVYCLYNKRERKYYIGSSNNIGKRLRVHLRQLNSDLHVNKELSKAWARYGPSFFSLKILEDTEPSKLKDREKYYIEKYRTHEKGYNQTPRGEGRIPRIKFEKKKKRRARKKFHLKDLVYFCVFVLVIYGAGRGCHK